MAKPIGPICNLDCEYCYYLHKEELYPRTTSWRMPEPTLTEYIRQFIEAQPQQAKEITFTWQGGEPTLLGLDFFRRVVALQKQFAPRHQRVTNSLQTNGVLLDQAWVDFFREEGFLIGLSIDGPRELHDQFRYDKKGEGSFQAVLNAMKLLKSGGVEFNALVVVNRVNADHGKRVYTYLRDNGVQYLQFIPIVERRGIGVHAEPPFESAAVDSQAPTAVADSLPSQWDHLVSSRSVRPEQYGQFLIEIFDEWIRRDVGKVFVQIFDQALSAWLGIEPSLCVFRKQCGQALALEHNGDLYSCDHYVEPEYRLGNIHDVPLVQLALSGKQQSFGAAKETTLPDYCRSCEVRFACNGECPKNRFITTPDGEAGLNYLCAGYQLFFNHIDPWMQQMATEIRSRRSPANVMQQFRQAQDQKEKRPSRRRATRTTTSPNQPQPAKPRSTPPARNAPCPCGSGRKYKTCCGQNR